MATPTKEEWAKIHAKAWLEPKFREMLEQDPKAALDHYGKETGKTFSHVVSIGPKPAGVPDDELYKHAQPPPACC